MILNFNVDFKRKVVKRKLVQREFSPNARWQQSHIFFTLSFFNTSESAFKIVRNIYVRKVKIEIEDVDTEK